VSLRGGICEAPVAGLQTGTRAAARRAGLAGVKLHVLCHTAATWMVEAGNPIEQVAHMLGSTVSLENLCKHARDHLREAVSALNGRLKQ
jgi:site-specific recombinase XerD